MAPTNDDKYAATSWASEKFSDLTVPSGQLCQVRRPGVQGLIAVGILDKVQGLTTLVGEEHVKRVKGQQKIDVQGFMKDSSKIEEAMVTIDKIVCYVVNQPSIKLAYKTSPTGVATILLDQDREEGQIYSDMVDFEDKMFIFHFAVGGSRDLERFREERAKVVASLQDGRDIPLPAK